MCGITTSGEEECYWDCNIQFTDDLGPNIVDPKCLLDCFVNTNCVEILLNDRNGCSTETIQALTNPSCIREVYKQPPIVTKTIEEIVQSKCFNTRADLYWLCFSSVEIFADPGYRTVQDCMTQLTSPPITSEQPTCDNDVENNCYDDQNCTFTILQGAIQKIDNPETCLMNCFDASSCIGLLLNDPTCSGADTVMAINDTSCISSIYDEQSSLIFNSIYDLVKKSCDNSVVIEWYCYIAFNVLPSEPKYASLDECREVAVPKTKGEEVIYDQQAKRLKSREF